MRQSSKQPSYGVAGYRKAEFCSEHAETGIVDVVSIKCGSGGYSKRVSHGVAGSRKVDLGVQHETVGVVNLDKVKYGKESDSKQPSYGVLGREKAEVCSQHATADMIDLHHNCNKQGCSNRSGKDAHGVIQGAFCRQDTVHQVANRIDTAKLVQERDASSRGRPRVEVAILLVDGEENEVVQLLPVSVRAMAVVLAVICVPV